MVTATRMLEASSTLFAEKGRWNRQGTILTAGSGEGLGILEPMPWFEGGLFKLLYRSGGVHGPNRSIRMATSPDALAWTKLGSILGSGAGGESAEAMAPRLLKVGSTYNVYYNTGADLRCATTPDFSTWTLHGSCHSLPGGMVYWGNPDVWLEGSTYYMTVELYNGTIWQVYLLSSSDGFSFSFLNSGNPLTSLQPNAGGMYGGMDIHPINGLLQGWFHAASGAGNLPTDLYRGHSSDRINWTIVRPNPLLTHTGLDYEVDQVADGHVLEVSGTSYLFYDADDNTTDVCAIKLATFAGTLSQLVGGR